jgi:hypothetical protein
MARQGSTPRHRQATNASPRVLFLRLFLQVAVFFIAPKTNRSVPAYFFLAKYRKKPQKTDFVRPEADILSPIPRFSVDEFAKEDEKYG